MRIIGGIAKGRRLMAPKGASTRPFTGMVKEAVFSSLGARVEDAAVLDLYAGTGSIGLEALSRGAASATFVEWDGPALEALEHNVEVVGLGGEIRRGPVERVLASLGALYDIAFVDPPFALDVGDLDDVMVALAPRLRVGAAVLVHRRRGTTLEPPVGTMLSISRSRRYGDSEVWWLDKETR